MNEKDMIWRKSGCSGGNTNACVEAAETPEAALVRDTRHRGLGHLGFSPGERAAFLADLTHDRL